METIKEERTNDLIWSGALDATILIVKSLSISQ